MDTQKVTDIKNLTKNMKDNKKHQFLEPKAFIRVNRNVSKNTKIDPKLTKNTKIVKTTKNTKKGQK